jgi:hypothetical protein
VLCHRIRLVSRCGRATFLMAAVTAAAIVTGCDQGPARSAAATGSSARPVLVTAAALPLRVGPGQYVATGTQETVTIVAFDLGNCDGKLMYRAVEWYFPQHGDRFNPSQYEDICTGSYVGQ